MWHKHIVSIAHKRNIHIRSIEIRCFYWLAVTVRVPTPAVLMMPKTSQNTEKDKKTKIPRDKRQSIPIPSLEYVVFALDFTIGYKNPLQIRTKNEKHTHISRTRKRIRHIAALAISMLRHPENEVGVNFEQSRREMDAFDNVTCFKIVLCLHFILP